MKGASEGMREGGNTHGVKSPCTFELVPPPVLSSRTNCMSVVVIGTCPVEIDY